MGDTKLATATADVAITGSVAVETIPYTEIALDPVKLDTGSKRITKPLHQLEISGTQVGLPGERPASLSWTVTYDDGRPPLTRSMRGKVKPEGSRFTFEGEDGEPPLHVLWDQLIGKGQISYSLDVDFPHCPDGRAEDGVITFNNPVTVTMRHDGADIAGKQLLLGTPVEVTVDFGGLASEIKKEIKDWASLRFVVHEADTGVDAGERKKEIKLSAKQRKRERAQFDWQGSDWLRGDVCRTIWNVGCSTADGGVLGLAMLENPEQGNYEFSWILSLDGDKRDEDSFFAVQSQNEMVSAPRPKIRDFSMSVAPDYRVGGSTASPMLVVSAKVEGFHASVPVRFVMSLWRRVGKSLEIVDREREVVLGPQEKDGSRKIVCRLFRFPYPHSTRGQLQEELDSATAKLGEELFCALSLTGGSFSESVSAAQVFGTDAKAHPPFNPETGHRTRRGRSITTAKLSLETVLSDVWAAYRTPFLLLRAPASGEGKSLAWVRWSSEFNGLVHSGDWRVRHDIEQHQFLSLYPGLATFDGAKTIRLAINAEEYDVELLTPGPDKQDTPAGFGRLFADYRKANGAVIPVLLRMAGPGVCPEDLSGRTE